MAESTLNLTYTNLLTEAAFLIGDNTATPANATRLDECIQSGYRKFLFPPPIDGPTWKWSFMHPRYELSMNAPFEEGTVAIVAGVVTKTGGGNFPSWAAAGEVIIQGEHYTVNTRDNNSQLTLDDTTVAADAGSGYSLVQTLYALPDDFGWTEEQEITFEPSGVSRMVYGARRVNETKIRELRATYPERKAVPDFFAIFVDTHVENGTESVRWNLQFWPIPDAAYKAGLPYTRNPGKISESNDYFLGGAQHAETIREAVLSEVERVFHDGEGVHTQRFLDCLRGSISLDKQTSSPLHLGYNGDYSDEWEWGEPQWFPHHFYDQRYYSTRDYTAP